MLKNTAYILEQVERFLVLAQDAASELQNKLNELAEKKRVKGRESYDMLQEYLDSHPEELKRYLDSKLEVVKRYQARKKMEDPVAFRAKQREAEKRYAAKQKARKAAGDIEGLVHYLSKELYFKRSKIMDQAEFESFNLVVKDFQDFQEKVKDLLYGYSQSRPARIATKDELFSLIADAKRLGTHLNFERAQNLIQQIINKLQELADNYVAKGPLPPSTTD